MFRLCLMVSLLAIVRGSPIPTNPINATIFNIEQFFEHSLGNLAGTLISKHKPNSTEHYQSSDGSVQAEVEPINLSLLQGIAFHPSNHQLIAEHATTVFNNATEEVDLIKVDLAPSTTTTTPEAVAATSSNDTLKEIPTTIVSGTTTTTTEVATSSSTTAKTTTTTTSAPTTKSVPVVIVTAVTEAATIASSSSTASNVTTEAAKPSTTDDISVKIKEVEAEPVILSSGV